ncbi:GNAT family N-acetyltransferase [Microbacterium sp. NPDC057650]|uniref:GNAT family N-acetyltransferase n=1 Tax=unclassified Microbacterium TaxID=2609290 RepID=UPI00366D18C8
MSEVVAPVLSELRLRPATADDLEEVVALKARVLRADLERLLGWDPEKSRARVVEHFSPAHTRMILVGDVTAGTITLRPEGEDVWLEMFYLDDEHQGRGLGTAVLATVLAETTAPLRLQVLVGSPAQRLYARHGFVVEEDDGIDVWMRREPTGVGPDTAPTGVRIAAWEGDAEALRQAADLYGRVFAEPPYGDDIEQSRLSFVERVNRNSVLKPDFRLVLAVEGARVVGLVMGAGIADGDWWRDRIAGALEPGARGMWLGEECFSVEELAVEPEHRRSGLAGLLMAAVLTGLPHETAVLGCYAAAHGARRFYASQGWEEIARGLRIAEGPAIDILGSRLRGTDPKDGSEGMTSRGAAKRPGRRGSA